MENLSFAGDSKPKVIDSIEFEPDDYRHHVQEFGLTQAQEDELLETLWHIMSTMVDIGWGVDNIQIMLPKLFNRESNDDKNNVDKPIQRESGIDDE